MKNPTAPGHRPVGLRSLTPLGSPAAPISIDSKESDRMIALGLRWLPFGGVPTEDIFVEFGIGSIDFYSRLCIVLESRQDIPASTQIKHLLNLCRSHIGRPALRTA